MKKLILTFFLMGVVSASSHFDARVGYRCDYLRWKIGGKDIKIVSELTWRDLDIIEGRLRYDYYIDPCWFVWAELGGGGIVNGESQDSDFKKNGREEEFSRSFSDVSGYTLDSKLAFGYRFNRCWIGHLGVAYQTLYFSNRGLRYEIPKDREGRPKTVGVSTYEPEWTTAFIGIEGRKCWDDFELTSSFEFHLGAYNAHANWKLRHDFDYFFDIALAYGLVWNLNGEWCLSKCLRAVAGVGVSYWSDMGGYQGDVKEDKVIGAAYYSVQWVSISANLGLRYTF